MDIEEGGGDSCNRDIPPPAIAGFRFSDFGASCGDL
ncbi:hypothetical protein Lser_V15G32605 [Lactuca serriola]